MAPDRPGSNAVAGPLSVLRHVAQQLAHVSQQQQQQQRQQQQRLSSHSSLAAASSRSSAKPHCVHQAE